MVLYQTVATATAATQPVLNRGLLAKHLQLQFMKGHLDRVRTSRITQVLLRIQGSKVILAPPPRPSPGSLLKTDIDGSAPNSLHGHSHENSSHSAVYGFVAVTEVMTPARVHV